jgi:hypothetical protein
LAGNLADLDRARKVARTHGIAWNDDENVEAAVRNLLTILSGERDLHAREVQKLKREIAELKKRRK